jgi:putative hydrolase of HD superfamily
MLPSDQAAELYALWQEFELARSAESRFANALDRLQPFLHNYVTAGKSWQEHNIRRSQVLDRMKPVQAGSQLLWEHVCRLLDDAVERGFLRK